MNYHVERLLKGFTIMAVIGAMIAVAYGFVLLLCSYPIIALSLLATVVAYIIGGGYTSNRNRTRLR